VFKSSYRSTTCRKTYELNNLSLAMLSLLRVTSAGALKKKKTKMSKKRKMKSKSKMLRIERRVK
jgi:hypothetical protein